LNLSTRKLNKAIVDEDINILTNVVDTKKGKIKTTRKKKNCCLTSVRNSKKIVKSYWYFYMGFLTSPFVIFAYESVSKKNNSISLLFHNLIFSEKLKGCFFGVSAHIQLLSAL
jgi:hypothetical protein